MNADIPWLIINNGKYFSLEWKKSNVESAVSDLLTVKVFYLSGR